MKKLIAIVLLILALTVVLSGCFLQLPFAEQSIATNVDIAEDSKPTIPTRELYVSGAVQNDGYITVPQPCDFKTVAAIVGLSDFSFMPSDPSSLLSRDANSLIVNFTINRTVYYSIDVNDVYVTSRLSIDGVDDIVVNKIADYIESNGTITNRSQLKMALGEDYLDNYYKFFISIDDYA